MDEEEHEKGICCMAAPVRDHSGHVVAALSLSGTNTNFWKNVVLLCHVNICLHFLCISAQTP